jgi:glycerol kinase
VNNMLMQFQSDLLQVPVMRPKTTELTALGAAYLAGLAIGFWKNIDELKNHWSLDKEFFPTMQKDQSIKMYKKWTKAVEISQLWQDHKE